MKKETISNAYQLLEIQTNATEEDIKKAYRKLSIEYHPDKHNNSAPANAMFKLITQAKNVLLDPVSRLEHDYALGVKSRPVQVTATKKINEKVETSDGVGILLAVGLVGFLIGSLSGGSDSK